MSITRSQVLDRAHAIPLESYAYSQEETSPVTGYRADCSGWVLYCWDGPHDQNTDTMLAEGTMVAIDRAELRPGDAIGRCGPGTDGSNGHVALWLGKAGRQEHVLDHGSGMGPKDHAISWGAGYGAYRLVGIVEDNGSSIEEGDTMFCQKGDGTGAGEPSDKVKAVQVLILQAGGTLAQFGVDGSYGDETAAALVALKVCGGVADGSVYGPTEYAKLHALAGAHQASLLASSGAKAYTNTGAI